MKSGLLLVGIALLLGGLVGTLVVADPGYVLISYADMAVETSLWFALLSLLAGYCLIRLLSFLFFRAASSGGKVGRWLSKRKTRSARDNTLQGLLQLMQGEWTQARKLLTSAAPRVDSPLINYLSAARAAQELGDMEGRDELLREANSSSPDDGFTVGLMQAELQKSAQQWDACLATLLHLRQMRQQAARNPRVLQLLVETYRALGDWQAMLELLPDTKKQKIFSAEQSHNLALEGWTQRFATTTTAPEQIWEQVPKELKREPVIVSAYATAAAKGDNNTSALQALRAAIQHNWDGALVRRYGMLQGDNPQEQLVVAEGWLKERPNDADLLLTLGRISMMNEAWANAREYLETSLRLARSADVYAELGRLCSAMGDVDRGNEYLLLSLPALPQLPLPDHS